MPAPSLNIRWTEADKKEGLPKRYEDALDKCGGSLSGTTRALIRCFTEEIERDGCTAIQKSVDRILKGVSARIVLNEPSPKYQAKKKRPT